VRDTIDAALAAPPSATLTALRELRAAGQAMLDGDEADLDAADSLYLAERLEASLAATAAWLGEGEPADG
jgi:hypothetical protein